MYERTVLSSDMQEVKVSLNLILSGRLLESNEQHVFYLYILCCWVIESIFRGRVFSKSRTPLRQKFCRFATFGWRIKMTISWTMHFSRYFKLELSTPLVTNTSQHWISYIQFVTFLSLRWHVSCRSVHMLELFCWSYFLAKSISLHPEHHSRSQWGTVDPIVSKNWFAYDTGWLSNGSQTMISA